MEILNTAQNIINRILNTELSDYTSTLHKNLNDALIQLVFKLKTDSLTGAYNRGFLEELLNELIQNKTPVVVIFIDLDDFKKVNEIFGHQIGDKGLKLVGSIINKYKPANSFFARYGGDEFVLLADSLNNYELNESISKMKHELKEKSDLLNFNLTVTVAVTNLNNIYSVEKLYEKLSLLIRKQKNTKKDEIISDIL
ncbi:GGDEF domain-containing protein [Patescibacteria group bacterium]|nr:GGDEF domain-containing protein [Patescibacteria group bacterium]